MRLGHPVESVRGRAVVVPGDDLDTDRIIPARFLRCVTFDGLGEHLFADERVDPTTGQPTGHPLDAPVHQGARVMISGMNFGCGSSREHAPQSIRRAGFEAIVAGSFAEIFFGNATTLGIVCATLPAAERQAVAELVEREPTLAVVIDVESSTLAVGGRTFSVGLPDGARRSLLSGRWDPLQLLRERQGRADQALATMPYVTGFGG